MYADRRGKLHQLPRNITPKESTSVYGILVQNNKLLVVKCKWSSLWEFPGGTREIGESNEEALTREFFEETGLRIAPGRLVAKQHALFYADDLNQYFNKTLLFFIVSTDEHTPSPGEEITSVHWLRKSPSKNVHPLHSQVINNLFKTPLA
ncbi:MAG: NUDIX domain-containing protein [archaeon]